jgi:hypothetical protein
MKIYLERVEVEPAAGRPQRIRWRKQRYNVETVVDFWISQTKWWSREEKRTYLRLMTDRGMMEIYRHGIEWILSRLAD